MLLALNLRCKLYCYMDKYEYVQNFKVYNLLCGYGYITIRYLYYKIYKKRKYNSYKQSSYVIKLIISLSNYRNKNVAKKGN
jgi:hypothetical protein